MAPNALRSTAPSRMPARAPSQALGKLEIAPERGEDVPSEAWLSCPYFSGVFSSSPVGTRVQSSEKPTDRYRITSSIGTANPIPSTPMP